MQQDYTDTELLALLKEDEDQAIEFLFRQYYAYLCRAVYKILPDASLIEDMVQEVFLELWKKRNQINIKTSIKAYLRRAAVNKTLNYIRDRKIIPEDEDKLPALRSAAPSISQEMEAEELQVRIDAAIDALPEKCRLIFVLSRFEEMSYKEIAQQLDISVKTVENQISKALKRILREDLANS